MTYKLLEFSPNIPIGFITLGSPSKNATNCYHKKIVSRKLSLVVYWFSAAKRSHRKDSCNDLLISFPLSLPISLSNYSTAESVRCKV